MGGEKQSLPPAMADVDRSRPARVTSAGASGRSAVAPAHPRSARRGSPGWVLALQRAAGNRAVDSLLTAPPAEGAPRRPDGVEAILGATGQPFEAPHRAFREGRFGRDFSGVTVHTDAGAGASARSLNALAYTLGNHIVFGRGSYDPASAAGRRLLAHELAHVVQQEGASAPAVGTKLALSQPGDPAEQEADRISEEVMGDAPPAAHARTPLHHAGQLTVQRQPSPSPSPPTSGGGAAPQERVTTWGGDFIAGIRIPSKPGSARGAVMTILFVPNELVTASAIGLTQTHEGTRNGDDYFFGDGYEWLERRARANTGDQPGKGRYIDAIEGQTNPMYNMTNPSPGGGIASKTTSQNDEQAVGHRTVDAAGHVDMQPAVMWDTPSMTWTPGMRLKQVFETTALAMSGPMAGTYLGSVEWGVQTDEQGEPKLLPFRLLSRGVPSPEFMASAKNWNSATVSSKKVEPSWPLVEGTITSMTALQLGARLPGETWLMNVTPAAGPVSQVRSPAYPTMLSVPRCPPRGARRDWPDGGEAPALAGNRQAADHRSPLGRSREARPRAARRARAAPARRARQARSGIGRRAEHRLRDQSPDRTAAMKPPAATADTPRQRPSALPSPSASTQMAPVIAQGAISAASPASTGVSGRVPLATT